MKKNSKLRKFVSQALVLALVLTQLQVVTPKPVLATWISGTLDFSNLTPYSVTLSWAAATNGGDTGYRVYQDSMFIFETSGTIYDVTGLIPNKPYEFKIEAMDTNGFWSTDGPTVSVTTLQDAAPADITPPVITGTAPLDGTVDVPVDSDIMVYFSEAIDLVPDVNGISLMAGSTPVGINVAPDGDLYIYPINILEYSTTYTVTIQAGAVQDWTGNTLASDYTYNFTTEAEYIPPTPPTVIYSTPENGALNIPVNTEISVHFSEDIYQDETFGNISLTSGGNPVAINTPSLIGDTMTITPVNQLVYGTDYQVIIPAGAVSNAANDTLPSDYVFSFTTIDSTINDPNLANAIRWSLDNYTGPITPSVLSSVYYLSAGEGGITDLTGLQYAVNLTDLNLNANYISDLSPLSGLTNLTTLELANNQISDLSPLNGLTNLTNLYLSSNKISDLSPLSGLTNISDLGLDFNQITDLSPLSSLSNLNYLSLEDNLISNISPLAVLHQNGGLASGSTVYVIGNFLDVLPGSPSDVIIQNLILNGVYVFFDWQKSNQEIASTVPAANSAGVSINTGIDISFQNNITPGSYIEDIAITPMGGTGINYTYNTNVNNLHLSPLGSLQENTTYFVTIPEGVVTYPDATYNAVYSFSFTTTSIDTIPPTWPTGSTLTVTQDTYSSLILGWTPATDNVGIDKYYIYQDGTSIGTAAGSVNTYYVTGLAPSATYNFSIKAVDTAGNISAGPALPHTTLPLVDVTGITLSKPVLGISPGMTAKQLTRAEAVRFVVNSFDLLDMSAQSTFSDVPSTDPYYPEISSAVAAGIVSGYADNTFRPGEFLTRAEFAALMVLASGYPHESTITPFSDIPSDYWAAGYIAAARNAGFILGYPDGTFRPDTIVSLELTGKLTARITPFDASSKKVIWSTSDASIATVSAFGQVTGLAAGSAVITATSADGGLTATSNVIVSDGTVTFPDANLETAVLDALNQTTGPVSMADLNILTNLDAAERGIMDLTGLEKAVNLTNLNLSKNQITALDPLIDLKNLTVLDLSYNRLTDVLPLLLNRDAGGLKNGSYVDVTYNHLDLWEGSNSYYDLQYLISSGIDVVYEPQSLALAPPSGPRMAFIPDFSSDTVTVVDLGKQSVVRTIYGFDQPWAVAVNPKGNKVYVTNIGNNSISVIDPLSHKIINTILDIFNPRGAALSPDGKRLYVTNSSEGTVSVIDTSTDKLIGSPIPVGTYPQGIVSGPAGTEVYVANISSNNVSIINTTTNTVTSVPVGMNPYGLDITPDGKLLYVTNDGSSVVSVIDLATKNVIDIEVGSSNQAIVISPDGLKAYTASYDTGAITRIDTSTNTVTGFVYAGTNPSGISISPGGGLLAVANYGSNDLSIFDAKSLTLIKNVPVGTNPGAFGKFIKMFPPTRAYIPNNLDDTVSVIDAFTDQVDTIINTTGVGTMPYGVAISPDMERAYITNYGDNTLSVIDIEANKVISTLPVGSGPKGVAANPQGTMIYLANNLDNTITVIDTSDNAVVSTIDLPQNSSPQGIIVSPGGGRILTANTGTNSVSIVNALNNTVENTVYGFSQPYSLAAVGDGSYVYVTNSGANTISMLDTRKFQVVDTIDVGTNPFGITATRDGSKLYVSNFDDNTVTVIDAAYHLNYVSDTINVGSDPAGIAITPDNRQVFVVNSGDNTVSLINTADNTVMDPPINVGHNPIALGQFIGPGLKSRLTPPAVREALAIGYQVKLSYDRILDETSVPAASDFTVTVDSAPAAVTKVTVLGARVDLTLSAPVSSGQIMTVDYTPGASPVREVAGLPSAGFTGLDAETDRPVLKTILAQSGSSQLDLYFSEPLVADSWPYLEDFQVEVDNVQVTVHSVQVLHRHVYIDIGQSVGANQNISIDYTPGLYPLRNSAGILVAPIIGASVFILSPDSFEPDNDYTLAGSIPTDGTIQTHTILSLPYSDIDWMKLDAVEGAEFIIETPKLSSTMLPLVFVYDTDGVSSLASNYADPSQPLAWVAPADGTYYISVEHADSWAGKYDISVSALPYPQKTSDTGISVYGPVTIPFSDTIMEGFAFSEISLVDSLSYDPISCNISIMDNNLIISPLLPLSHDSSYEVLIPPGALENIQGDPVSAEYCFYLTTEPFTDTTPPDWAGITLNLSNLTQTGASLSWETPADPDDAVVSYAVYLNDQLLDYTSDTYFDLTGLNPDTYYSIGIRAVDSNGNWSTDLMASLSTSLPTWPAGALNDVEVTSTGITLSWTSAYDSSSPVVAYSVYQYGYLLDTVDAPSNTYEVTGLSPNTSYTFRVEAQNSFGLWSTTGPEKTVTTLPPPDTTLPRVVSTAPVSSSTDIHVDTQITIKFSENIRPGNSINAISLKNDRGMVVDFVYDLTGDTLTLTPTLGLATSNAYYVSIPPDAVTDSGNNSLEGVYTFSFTTSITKDANLENLLRTVLNIPSGPITSSSMINLTILDAADRDISDLSGLEHAVNLKRLYLGNNLISDLKPISQLTGLEELWLNNNQISDISYLQNLSSLKWLYLNQNDISSIEPLSGSNKLEVLYLNNNDITDVSWLKNLTSLLSLGLGFNNISDISQLGSLHKLQMLDLQGQGKYESLANTLSKISVINLTNMPKLCTLLLNDNNIRNLTSLQGLTKLTKLTLWNNGITDSDSGGITPLAGLNALTDLWLDNNNIRSLTPLTGLTNLKVLSLAGNNNISDFSALVSNTGLGTGDHLDLPTTASDTYLQSLTNKSITVSKR